MLDLSDLPTGQKSRVQTLQLGDRLAKIARTPIMGFMEPLSQEQLGDRIRQLRKAADLTGDQVATATGLSAPAISRIEHGTRSVKSTELARIASALGVSVLALLDPESLASRLQVAARPGETADVQRNDGVVERLRGFVELSSLLPSDTSERSPKMPAHADLGWQDRTAKHAQWVRKQLGMEPNSTYRFGELASLIERCFHVDVVVEAFPGSIIGATISDPGCPVIFVNADQPLQRARFTLGHELYHFLQGDGQSVVFDEDLSGPEAERDANAFAASFLMPKGGIEQIIEERGRGAASIGEMLVRFGVSYQALAYRLHNAGLIRASGRDRLLAAGFGGLLSQLSDDDLTFSLQELRTAFPGRRTPPHLTARAVQAFLAHDISIRPLANLTNEDAEDLLEQLRPGDIDEAAFDGSYADDVEIDDSEMDAYFSSSRAGSSA